MKNGVINKSLYIGTLTGILLQITFWNSFPLWVIDIQYDFYFIAICFVITNQQSRIKYIYGRMYGSCGLKYLTEQSNCYGLWR